MKLTEFAVKMVFRVDALGEPEWTDERYDEGISKIVEEVYVIPAKSVAEAFRLTTEFGAEIAELTEHQNCYGQAVRKAFLGICEVHEIIPMDKQVFDYRQVFMSVRLVPKAFGNKEIADQLLGDERAQDFRNFRMFLNPRFALPGD